MAETTSSYHPSKPPKPPESPVPHYDNGHDMKRSNTVSQQVDTDASISSRCNGARRKRTRTTCPSASRSSKRTRRTKSERSIVEYLQPSRPTTSNGKSKASSSSTQSTKSSATSAAASSTSGRDSRGFWTESVKAWSKKLWLPTKTGWQDLEPSSSNGSSKRPVHASSFSTSHRCHPQQKSLRTSWRSCTYSLAGSTAKEDTGKLSRAEINQRSKLYKTVETEAERKALKQQLDQERVPSVQRMRSVRMLTTPKQHHYLLVWLKDARWTYNQALQHVLRERWHRRECGTTIKEMEATLVRQLVSKAGLHGKSAKRLRTPKVIRQQAVKALLASIKMFRTKLTRGKITRFRPKFKTKRIRSDTMRLEAKSLRLLGVSKCSIYRKWKPREKKQKNKHKKSGKNLGREPQQRGRSKSAKKKEQKRPSTSDDSPYVLRYIKLGEQLTPEHFGKDFGIHFHHGKFYLMLTRTLQVPSLQKVVEESSVDKVLAVDPGVRRFATCYSPEGRVVIYGDNPTKVIDKLIRREFRRKKAYSKAIQQLKHAKETGSTRQQRRKKRVRLCRARGRYHKAIRKSRNVVKDFHFKVAHDMLQGNRTIILPKTSSHRWRTGAKLAGVCKRRIQKLSFGLFASRLVQTSTMYSGSKIVRGSEAYTSKQCGQCGKLNDKLGSSICFNCPTCGLQSDRDIHAARNILLRFLSPLD